MKFFTPFAMASIIIGSAVSFRLDLLAENTNEERIVGGATADPGQFPYQASLQEFLTDSHVYKCGASIISDRWVISAAHCTQNDTIPSKFVVLVGTHRIDYDGQVYDLEKVVNHPEFNMDGYRNDIVLLQTKKMVQLNDVVQPIPLGGEFADEGVIAIASGWGRLSVRSFTFRFPWRRFWANKLLF